MASSSVESQVLENEWPRLVTNLQHSVKTLSDKCMGKGYIAKETSYKIMELDSTNADKARLLLGNLKTTFADTPEAFEGFVTILEEEKSHEDLAKTLRIELEDLRNRRVRTEPEQASGPQNDAGDSSFVPCVEEEQGPSVRKRKGRAPIANAKRYLRNAVKELDSAELDNQQTVARLDEEKENLKGVKYENAELKEEIRKYSQTIDKLASLLGKKDKVLKSRIPLLEKNLAVAEKKSYEEMKERGQLREQLTYLLKYNSDFSKQIKELLNEKQVLQHDLSVVKDLLREAEANSKDFSTLEAEYETVCQQLEDKKEELREEQNISQDAYDTLQDQRRTETMYKYAYCFIIVVLLVFATVIITFSYCLEDELNHNIKQCTRRALNIVKEYCGA